jgi:hypothetical protein
MMPTLPRVHYAWFFPISVVALLLVEYWIAQTAAFATHPDALAFAITLDVVLGIPLLGYWCLVRPRHAPATVLAPLFLLAVLIANFILPESGKRYLNGIEMALPILEIAFLFYAALKLRKSIQHYRVLRPTTVYAMDAIEQSLQQGMGKIPAIGILLIELSLLYYALGGWFKQYQPTHPGHRPFSYHLKSGYGVTIALMIGLSLIEIVLVHLVVHQFNPTVAWILTFLTLYTVLWLIGDYQAIRLHPIVVDDTHLHLRAGMRWRVSLSLTQIHTLRALHYSERQNKTMLDCSIAGNPKLLLELHEPVIVRGLFGIKRQTDKIAFAVDDEKAFLETLRQSLFVKHT